MSRRIAIEEMKELMQPGDELWEYDSPTEAWDQGLGLAGLEIIRNGGVVTRKILRMN